MKTAISAFLPDGGLAQYGEIMSATLPSGRILHMQSSPSDIDSDDIEKLPSTVRGVVEVVRTFTDLDRQVAGVARDGRLTDVGRAEKLREPREAAWKAFGYAYEARVLAHAVSTADMEGQFYKLPEPSAFTYQRDRHILDLVMAAPKEKADAIFRHTLEGNDEEFALALVRAPKVFDFLFEGRIRGQSMRQYAERAWRAAVDKREPEKAAMVKLANNLNAWGERTFRNLARELSEKKSNAADLLGDELRGNSKKFSSLLGHAHRLF